MEFGQNPKIEDKRAKKQQGKMNAHKVIPLPSSESLSDHKIADP